MPSSKKPSHSYSDTALIRSVEGYPLPITVQYPLREPMKNEEINDLIQDKGGKADLVAFLRSDLEISPRIRNWLADMLSEDAETPKKLILQNRSKKRPKDSRLIQNLRSSNAALYMEKLMTSGTKKEAAAMEASEEYGLDISAVKKAHKKLLKAREFEQSIAKSLQAKK